MTAHDGRHLKRRASDNVAPAEDEVIVNSEELFRGKREITIVHRGLRYKLQITKMGKLIMNK